MLMLAESEALRQGTGKSAYSNILWTVVENLTPHLVNKSFTGLCRQPIDREGLIFHITLQSAHIWSLKKCCYKLLQRSLLHRSSNKGCMNEYGAIIY